MLPPPLDFFLNGTEDRKHLEWLVNVIEWRNMQFHNSIVFILLCIYNVITSEQYVA